MAERRLAIRERRCGLHGASIVGHEAVHVTQLLRRFPRRRHRVQELEKAGLDVVWVAEAYSYDADQPGRLPRRQDRADRDRPGHHQRVLAHRHGHRPDRRRLRLRERRPLHPRPRRLRPAGHRGLPRRALRAPDAAHPRDHRGLPDGVEREPVVFDGQTIQVPLPDRPGHRARQAAEADQPPEARRHPGVLGQPDGPVGRRDAAESPTAGCRSSSIPRSSSRCGATTSPRA